MARPCHLAVISDCHLGTTATRAECLLDYLQAIAPDTLIVNGDLCDLGSYFQLWWPPTHLAVFARLLELAADGCDVVYVTGNHDAALRNLPPFLLPGIRVCEREIREIGGERILITHGDCLDQALGAERLIHRMASIGYAQLMRLDGHHQRLRRWCRLQASQGSLATAIKRRVPGSAAYVARFEAAALQLAVEAGCDGVLGGHIPPPAMRQEFLDGRAMRYLNSGDWVEHRSALEFDGESWRMVVPGQSERVPALVSVAA
jgi:UDP-2,3-diacylglucosamine pyrophosphatase LpxH